MSRSWPTCITRSKIPTSSAIASVRRWLRAAGWPSSTSTNPRAITARRWRCCAASLRRSAIVRWTSRCSSRPTNSQPRRRSVRVVREMRRRERRVSRHVVETARGGLRSWPSCREPGGVRAPDVSGVVLTGCGLVLLATFVTMAALGDLYATASSFVGLFVLASLAYGVAVAWIVRRPHIGRGGLAGIVVAAVAFRLVLLPTAPTLSTDLYRYLWDGRVSVAGLSPYRYPPTAPELSALRDEAIYPRLNHPDWRTIYPPGAQLLFTGMARLAPGNVVAFKLLIVALDLLALALLVSWLRTLGHSPAWALVYAWHPLVVVEFAGSGHLDAVAVAASVAALVAADRRREGWSGALLGLGAVVKLYPL